MLIADPRSLGERLRRAQPSHTPEHLLSRTGAGSTGQTRIAGHQGGNNVETPHPVETFRRGYRRFSSVGWRVSALCGVSTLIAATRNGYSAPSVTTGTQVARPVVQAARSWGRGDRMGRAGGRRPGPRGHSSLRACRLAPAPRAA